MDSRFVISIKKYGYILIIPIENEAKNTYIQEYNVKSGSMPDFEAKSPFPKINTLLVEVSRRIKKNQKVKKKCNNPVIGPFIYCPLSIYGQNCHRLIPRSESGF